MAAAATRVYVVLAVGIVAAAAGGPTACASKDARAGTPSGAPRSAAPASAPLAPLQRVIPVPASIEPGAAGDSVTLAQDLVILTQAGSAQPAVRDEVTRVARYLADLIGTAAGPKPPRVEAAGGTSSGGGAAPASASVPGTAPVAPTAPAGSIQLSIANLPNAGDEGYELRIGGGRVAIAANTPAGLFYGVQTLRHLLPPAIEYEAVVSRKGPPIVLPAATIVDRPRFVWRGAMLDVARHFFGVRDVERYIDLLALYKVNRLHLHLADDQGWRIEIKSWPNLTRHGGTSAVGGAPGGFYTQAEYTDLAAYARERFITIVPEIDMPGHTNAALASYPELNCDGIAPPLYTGIEVGFSAFCVDKDVTYKFIDDVVREIGGLSPSPYFHAGGDEVKKLTADQYRQFMERVQGIVQKHGKEMIGWDEIAPIALLPTTIVQHWRPEEQAAASLTKAPRIIMSPANRAYLDMKYDAGTPLGLNWAGNVDVRRAYEWDPGTHVKGVAEKAVLGVEAPIWSETLVHLHDVEYMAFPRLAAVAERGWSPSTGRQWEEFARRLGAQAPRWQALGVNFYRAPEVPWER